MAKRESFGSRLGFILVSAGCAIGIGNVWRFPYVAGEYGGGIFVLIYLLFLVIMGVPVMTMEFAVGRAGRGTAVEAYKALEKPGHKWHLHGWLCMIGCALLMMYYTTVSGWMLDYFFKFLTGSFSSGMTNESVAAVFNHMLGSPVEMGGWMLVTVVAASFVCRKGLQDGLEKVTKYMMALLLGLIVVLAMHSFTLSGAKEGLAFFLLPSLSRVGEQGLWNVVIAAMNQAFFTLSLGIGAMEIFGSCIGRDRALCGEAVRIAALDTLVAVSAGLIIFPACFSYGVSTDQGPSLIFMTLPNIFVNMPAGRIWGSLFFLFMTFASFSTVIAVFENLIVSCVDNFGWERPKAALVTGIAMGVLSLPCVFGYNIWSSLVLPGGRTVLDFEDFLVSNILLPGGALVYLLFCVLPAGWGFDNYLAEVNTGEGLKISAKLKPWFKAGLPALILVILLSGLL